MAPAPHALPWRAGRSSVGYDTDPHLIFAIQKSARSVMLPTNQPAARRLARHQDFVEQRTAAGKPLKYSNEPYGFPVVTRQEIFLQLDTPGNLVQADETRFEVSHEMAHIPLNTACLTIEQMTGAILAEPAE